MSDTIAIPITDTHAVMYSVLDTVNFVFTPVLTPTLTARIVTFLAHADITKEMK